MVTYSASPFLIFPMTPKPAPGARAALPSTSRGLGQHFTSPKKKRNPRKSQTLVSIPGQAKKRQRLRDRLNDLLNHKKVHAPATCETSLDAAPEGSALEMDPIGFMDVVRTLTSISEYSHLIRPRRNNPQLSRF